MKGTKPGQFFSNPDGQYINTLKNVAIEKHIDLNKAWQDLSKEEKDIILNGTGEKNLPG